METKEKNINKKVIFFAIIILIIASIYALFFIKSKNRSIESSSYEDINISNANEINIEEIIQSNNANNNREEIVQKEVELEYTTTYNINKELAKGEIQVIQEGREGKQLITSKIIYENNEIVSENQISSKITKASVNKIVEIGGASYTNNYKIKSGDNVYVTSDRLSVMSENNNESIKVATLSKDDEIKILEISGEWYRVLGGSSTGWVKKECTTYINPHSSNNYDERSGELTKSQLIAKLSFNMELNKTSGLSLNQFKKVLNDSRDKNKIFYNNAEYFYYIEKQYNINGIFVASVGIHESAWGTSKIALNKNNLFGYGAYDSNPYNGAYSFSSYSESIDLVSRVFVKYYLNPKGTQIYGGETAVGTYYSGKTLIDINKKYASDKNWANGVYTYIKYLYGKL